MALSQSLQQKLLQKLSPQQIQLDEAAAGAYANLEIRIKEELEENPALNWMKKNMKIDEDEVKDEFSRERE